MATSNQHVVVDIRPRLDVTDLVKQLSDLTASVQRTIDERGVDDDGTVDHDHLAGIDLDDGTWELVGTVHLALPDAFGAIRAVTHTHPLTVVTRGGNVLSFYSRA